MNTLDFSNRLIVITGVGRAGQVGEAIALGFAQRGATLALLDVQPAEVEARAASLIAQGFSASAHVANLANANAAELSAAEIIAKTQSQFDGAVHAVICVAGGFGMTGPLDSTDVAAWQKQFMINLDTAYNATRAFLPAVRAGVSSRRRAKSHDSRVGRGSPDRSPGIGAYRQRREPRGQGRRRSTAGSPRREPEVPRVPRGPEERIVGVRRQREFRSVRLCDRKGPGGA